MFTREIYCPPIYAEHPGEEIGKSLFFKIILGDFYCRLNMGNLGFSDEDINSLIYLFILSFILFNLFVLGM